MPKRTKDKDPAPDRGQIKLSVPWSNALTNIMGVPAEVRYIGTPTDRRSQEWLEEQDSRNVVERYSEETALVFLRERTRLHETYIKEQERTKRIGTLLAALLILGAAALILFAPEGRETLSYWIGAALVIFAAGSVGYRRIWGKSRNLFFAADQDRQNLESNDT